MSESERDAIEAVLAGFSEAWRTLDFTRWVELFTPDSDFITWRGAWRTSRAETVAAHRDVPPAIAAQMPNYRIKLVELDFLADTVALAHARWDWPNFEEAERPPQDRSGLITMVLVRQDGGWRIRALHNSRVFDEEAAVR